MANDSKTEQYLLLAKSTKGNAAVELIKKITEAPGIYQFGEFLSLPNFQELESGDHEEHFRLLLLFAYGTYMDYLSAKETFPTLNTNQLRKLKQLSIISLASANKCLPCGQLQKQLEVETLRELEDLVIELIYTDALKGKLDQQKATLEVEYTLGRDLRPEQITELSQALSAWCEKCESVLKLVGTEMLKANERRTTSERHRVRITEETDNLKVSIKAQLAQTQKMEVDDPGQPDLVGCDGNYHPGKSSAGTSSGEKDKNKKGMFKGLKSSRSIFSNK